MESQKLPIRPLNIFYVKISFPKPLNKFSKFEQDPLENRKAD